MYGMNMGAHIYERCSVFKINGVLVTIAICCSCVVLYCVVFEATLNDRIGTLAKHTQFDSLLLNNYRNRNFKELHRSSSQRPCTFGLFRDINAREHYFPRGGGTWMNDTVGHTKQYQPNACKFKYKTLPEPLKFMDRCFANAGTQSMLIMGDSTANRYARAMAKLSGGACHIISQETFPKSRFMPDKQYFTSKLPEEMKNMIYVQPRLCGCTSRVTLCSLMWHG